MTRRAVMIRVPEDVLARIDAAARREGMTRTDYMIVTSDPLMAAKPMPPTDAKVGDEYCWEGVIYRVNSLDAFGRPIWRKAS